MVKAFPFSLPYMYSANEKNYAERGQVDFGTKFLDLEARS